MNRIENTNADRVFTALADKSRRKIIELLSVKESTLLELSGQFPISFQALSKHINILEKAQVVIKKKQGKYRILSLNHVALITSLRWISFYSNFWNDSFEKLDNLIQSTSGDIHAE
jgi:DNA-binding transcriptional ArsR family regulator